jgi:hypothetical protein
MRCGFQRDRAAPEYRSFQAFFDLARSRVAPLVSMVRRGSTVRVCQRASGFLRLAGLSVVRVDGDVHTTSTAWTLTASGSRKASRSSIAWSRPSRANASVDSSTNTPEQRDAWIYVPDALHTARRPRASRASREADDAPAHLVLGAGTS